MENIQGVRKIDLAANNGSLMSAEIDLALLGFLSHHSLGSFTPPFSSFIFVYYLCFELMKVSIPPFLYAESSGVCC